VADGWCWFVLREEYCWLVAGGWFVLREKYCWLVADKPSEQGACLCLVRCLLYTFAVATCRSTPHLRHRNSRGSPPGRVVPLVTSRAASSPGPKCSWCATLPAFPDLRCRSIAVRAFGFEGQHRSDRSPLHNKTHITRVVLVFPSNPHRQDSLVLAGAACEPKPSTWLDVDRGSEGHFPQQRPPPRFKFCTIRYLMLWVWYTRPSVLYANKDQAMARDQTKWRSRMVCGKHNTRSAATH
jgi:hypothetical protein